MENKNLKSLVVPVLQSYEAETSRGVWTLTNETRLVIHNTEEYTSNARLKEVVDILVAEFSLKEMRVKQAFVEEDDIKAPDILITLDKSQAITDQSESEEVYKIVINEDGVKITAASENAVLYALRTVQQILITNNKELVNGTIVDFPDLSERRLHVDMGRKHFSKDWAIQHIRELSFLKVNTMQLHFAENMGFRIECETDPSIVSRDGFLTKKEVKEIIFEAQKYGIKIIPSLDTPGHVEHILKTHSEFGQIDKNGNKSTVALDVTNPEAVNYMKSLYSEYMELFQASTDFHIGGDEYMEFDRPPFTTEFKEVLENHALKVLGEGFTWKDVIADYINDIAAHVHAAGFKPRIFNDGVYYGENDTNEPKQQIKMHDYIGIDYWSQMGWNPSIAPLNVFIEKGHTDIYNLNANFFYYVLRNDMPEDGRKQHSFDHLNADQKIYNEFTPGIFDKNIVDDRADYIKGAQLSIWSDNPNIASEDDVTEDIKKELRAFASKTWNIQSNEIVDFDQFVENYQKLGHVAGFEKGSQLPKA